MGNFDPGDGPVYIGPFGGSGSVDAHYEYIRFEPDPDCPQPNTPPVIEDVSADPDQGDAPLDVDFTVEASDADGDDLSYSWDFDDGNSSNQQNPTYTYTYTDPGTYVAEVTVSDGTDSVTGSVTVMVTDGGTPVLDGRVMPKRKKVKPGKRARFTFRVANDGDATANKLRLCVKAPRKRVKVMGKACRRAGSLVPDRSTRARFTVKPKRSARGKRVKIRFTANGPGMNKSAATATLKVKR